MCQPRNLLESSVFYLGLLGSAAAAAAAGSSGSCGEAVGGKACLETGPFLIPCSAVSTLESLGSSGGNDIAYVSFKLCRDVFRARRVVKYCFNLVARVQSAHALQSLYCWGRGA